MTHEITLNITSEQLEARFEDGTVELHLRTDVESGDSVVLKTRDGDVYLAEVNDVDYAGDAVWLALV